MLASATLRPLTTAKNLLAFSAGVDSSALFFMLLEKRISFDIAIVNYQSRTASKEEVAYAKQLAKKYDKRCHLLEVTLNRQNFEATARKVRYDFFEDLIQENDYTNLITAHQLDDRLEWFLMQLSKGSGLHELLGFQSVEEREHYTLLRPLLEVSRERIERYLSTHNIKFFIDCSNNDESYKRNYFRHHLAKPLLQKYEKGVKKSFTYLNEDLQALRQERPTVQHIEALYYFKKNTSRRSAIIEIDRILKELGFLMRQGDKERLKMVDEHIVGRQYVVAFFSQYAVVAPYLDIPMSKMFKEQCRLLKIPKKLRPFLSEHPKIFEHLVELIDPT